MLFVDTSVWYAAADSGDRNALRAKKILMDAEELVTTDHVLVETWFLLRYRLGRSSAETWWAALRAGVAKIECVTLGDLHSAWEIGASFADQDFSLVDRTSFAVIQRLSISRAASFDSDFAVVRLGPRRDRALTILR